MQPNSRGQRDVTRFLFEKIVVPNIEIKKFASFAEKPESDRDFY